MRVPDRDSLSVWMNIWRPLCLLERLTDCPICALRDAELMNCSDGKRAEPECDPQHILQALHLSCFKMIVVSSSYKASSHVGTWDCQKQVGRKGQRAQV